MALGRRRLRAKKRPKKVKRGPLAKMMASRRAIRIAREVGDLPTPKVVPAPAGHAPVSLGDYCAGSNHVLPTAGCARHSSGLSVQTFLRGIHVVDYTEAALKDVAGHVITLAQAENLPSHGEAVRRRFES